MSRLETLRIDANLLLALDALLRERNVTRAAAAMGIGQPGMSHALQRLREHFRDPLLVRSGRGYALSPRASALVGPVRATVSAMREVFAPAPAFEPATAVHTFRLAATDGAAYVLLPDLLARLAARAPGVTIEVRSLPEGPLDAELASDRLDLAVTHFGALPATLRREVLWIERYVALVPARGAIGRGALTRARYERAGHVHVAPRPGIETKLRQTLRERGLAPRVAAVVPHFLLVPALVERSGLVATIARSLARRFAAHHDVRVRELPFAMPPYDIAQVWHERRDAEPAHRWLRGVVAEAARAAAATSRPGHRSRA